MPGCPSELQPSSPCHLPRCSVTCPKTGSENYQGGKKNQTKTPGDLVFRTSLVPCLDLLNRKRSRSSSNQGEGEHLPSSSSCDNTSHGQNTPWAQLTGISTSNISAWNLQIVDNICEAKTWLEVLSINEIQTHQTEKKQQPIRAGCLYSWINGWIASIQGKGGNLHRTDKRPLMPCPQGRW